MAPIVWRDCTMDGQTKFFCSIIGIFPWTMHRMEILIFWNVLYRFGFVPFSGHPMWTYNSRITIAYVCQIRNNLCEILPRTITMAGHSPIESEKNEIGVEKKEIGSTINLCSCHYCQVANTNEPTKMLRNCQCKPMKITNIYIIYG